MKHVQTIVRLVAVASVLTMFVAAQQSDTGSNQQSQSMQGMQQGMHGQMQQGQSGHMQSMMQDCHKNMQAMQRSNARTKKDIEAAKQSKDPAKMRAALDEADKALTSMDDHINTCMGMMNMMQGMHGKGTTSGEQSFPPKQ